jgi:2-polyprenyl-3-methyl-5-hydroxy-6-metoxy-1,4-benzoquinol methylase
MNERNRLDSVAGWYSTDQLNIDRAVLRFRYEAIRPHLIGVTGLELGPADGEMTRLLVGNFETLTVVDAAQELLDQIPSDPRITKQCALFEEFDPGRMYDTIVMDHVLEHVTNPQAILRLARSWTAPGGRLIAGVPNGLSLHRRAAVHMGLLSEPCALNDRDLALGHRRVFTPEGLRALVEMAGLRVIAAGGVFVKPLSYAQIQATWTPEMVQAFAQLGADLPDLAAEIFVVAEAR